MKRKKLLAAGLCAVLAVSMAACGGGAGSDSGTENVSSDFINYADLKIGEDFMDLTADIHVFNHRTDMSSSDYSGKTWEEYLADFNKEYPNITVEIETDTDYAESALLRLQSGDWGDIMMIPAVDAADLSEYFLAYGDVSTMEGLIRFPSQFAYKGANGHSLANECENGVVNSRRIWWVQAEAVVGFLNGYQRRPDRTDYLEAAVREWEFIKEHMIDQRERSEWYWETYENGTPVEGRPIVEPWKCPYHNGRMCMEVIRRGIDVTS